MSIDGIECGQLHISICNKSIIRMPVYFTYFITLRQNSCGPTDASVTGGDPYVDVRAALDLASLKRGS